LLILYFFSVSQLTVTIKRRDTYRQQTVSEHLKTRMITSDSAAQLTYSYTIVYVHIDPKLVTYHACSYQTLVPNTVYHRNL